MLEPNGGSGGGRRDFAQGGIKNFTDVASVVETGVTLIKEGRVQEKS